jgi:hypothetical protein
MLTRRFLISWLASSIVMFSLFYAWHGIFLTDFSRLAYPKEIFLVITSFVYLAIGFALTKSMAAKPLARFQGKPVLRGVLAGAVLGFAIFFITMVTGVSFGGTRTLFNLVLDVSWQTVEQAVGGTIIGIVHVLVYEPSFREEEDQ